MKYFLIAGEASGDLHASNLMLALRRHDSRAEFAFYGGDMMALAGGTLLCHYRHLAYMGFIPVLLHARTIIRRLEICKRELLAFRPDALILVDYPGFNLKLARFARKHALCPVFYYISPKLWAWKEYRIRALRRDVTRLFSILPFEIEFFEGKHRWPVTYVGNPTLDEVAAFQGSHGSPVPDGRTLALLPGSRRQEIKDNLSRMLRAAEPFVEGENLRLVVAAAPAIPLSFYEQIIARSPVAREHVVVEEGKTYEILSRAVAALVTSGTATLETALFGVPQVVCYFMPCGAFYSLLRKLFLKVPFISLVNLVCGEEVVPELVANGMTVTAVRRHLASILPGGSRRQAMLSGYEVMVSRLGTPGAPDRAAAEMVERLKSF